MKATMESTTKLLILNGLNIRVWEGVTENGVPFVALVNRVEAIEQAQQTMLIKELAVTKTEATKTVAALERLGVLPPAPAGPTV